MFVEDECGGTVDKNGTYVQNAGYPRGNNTLQLCKFDFKRIANGERDFLYKKLHCCLAYVQVKLRC